MGIREAVLALFDAPDTGRTATGPAQAAAAAVPTPAPPALGELLAVMGARLSTLEASVAGIMGNVKAEVDRAERSSEAGRRAVQRALRRMGDVEEQLGPGDDVPDDDDGARAPRGVLPLRRDVEAAPPVPPTAEEIRAHARRMAALGG